MHTSLSPIKLPEAPSTRRLRIESGLVDHSADVFGPKVAFGLGCHDAGLADRSL